MIEERDDGDTQSQHDQRLREQVREESVEAMAAFRLASGEEDLCEIMRNVGHEVSASWAEWRAALVAIPVPDHELPALWASLESSINMLREVIGDGKPATDMHPVREVSGVSEGINTRPAVKVPLLRTSSDGDRPEAKETGSTEPPF